MSAEEELQQVLEIPVRGLGTQVPLGFSGDRAGHGAYPAGKSDGYVRQTRQRHPQLSDASDLPSVVFAALRLQRCCEGINSGIQSLKHAAHGHPKFESLPIRVHFFLGKLDLTPA